MAAGGPGGAGGGTAGGVGGGGVSLGSAVAGGVAAVGTGLLAGVLVAAAILASGTVSFRGSTSAPIGSTLPLLACPGSGQVLGQITPNTRVFVTGRSADRTWLQVDFPGPGMQRAWVPAADLQPAGSVGSLPVTDCVAPSGRPAQSNPEPPAPTVMALVTPAPTTTSSPRPQPTATFAPTAKPTPRPTSPSTPTPSPKPSPSPTVRVTPRPTPKPTPKPTPTASPDQPPSGTIVSASPPYLSLLPYPGRCAEATVQAQATDDGKVVAAYLYFQPWSAPGASPIPVQSVAMTLSPASGLWTGTMYGNANWPTPTTLAAVRIAYYVVLVDDAKLTTRLDPGTNLPVTEVSCGR
jgi:hypothetical protein